VVIEFKHSSPHLSDLNPGVVSDSSIGAASERLGFNEYEDPSSSYLLSR
jgi:hypothetical protein